MNSIKTSRRILISPGIFSVLLILAVVGLVFESGCSSSKQGTLEPGFTSPPPEYRPGVYWYFMDGNLSREAMTRELEAMKEAGIGWALFLEVNVGVPRGQVDFLSQKWQELFEHAVKEGERLGIKIIMAQARAGREAAARGLSLRNPCSIWSPLSGEKRPLEGVQAVAWGGVRLEVRLEPEQGFFIVFKKDGSVAGLPNLPAGISSAPENAAKDETTAKKKTAEKNQSPDQTAGSGQSFFKNFAERRAILTLRGPWKVKFDPAWGGLGEVVLEKLLDWAIHPDDGIRYYSGTAIYTIDFDLPEGVEISRKEAFYLDLGEVFCLARVKLNGRDQGIVWTKPARVRLSGIKKRGNHLEIEAANLWINRLIGDENEPWDGVVNGQWPQWLLTGNTRPTKRLTFTTHRFYRQGDPLVPSGLLGPVRLLK